MLFRPLPLYPGADKSGHKTAGVEHHTAVPQLKKLGCVWMPKPASLLPFLGPEH